MSELNRRGFLSATAAGLTALSTITRASPGPSPADEDPLGVRGEFPVTQSGTTYLDTAAFSPIPKSVEQAGHLYLEDKMLGRSRNREQKEEARRRFCELFGAKEHEVAFLYSTTDGENIVAGSLDFRPGDNVVVDELHFTSTFVLYRQLEKLHRIELRIVPHVNGRARITDFDARIDARTKLVSVAWVSNRNGFRQDLRALADLTHDKGALLYADAIQALGYFPVSLGESGVDFAASGCYKWLLGTPGVSLFYVREELLDRIRPDRFGHGQVMRELPDLTFEMRTTARKYEYANPAAGPIHHLNAGLAYLNRVGLSRIEEHTASLGAELRDAIVKLGFTPFTPANHRTPIVSFEHGRDPEEISKRLRKENVVVTLREGGRVLRSGIALFNNRMDIARLVRVIETFA